MQLTFPFLLTVAGAATSVLASTSVFGGGLQGDQVLPDSLCSKTTFPGPLKPQSNAIAKKVTSNGDYWVAVDYKANVGQRIWVGGRATCVPRAIYYDGFGPNPENLPTKDCLFWLRFDKVNCDFSMDGFQTTDVNYNEPGPPHSIIAKIIDLPDNFPGDATTVVTTTLVSSTLASSALSSSTVPTTVSTSATVASTLASSALSESTVSTIAYVATVTNTATSAFSSANSSGSATLAKNVTTTSVPVASATVSAADGKSRTSATTCAETTTSKPVNLVYAGAGQTLYVSGVAALLMAVLV